jgi:beta-glucosidase
MPEKQKNSVSVEERVETLLSQLTVREKAALLSGQDAWHTVAVERLGLPSLVMTDGPHGVRSSQPEAGRIDGPATSFPTGVSMASSWNPALVEQVGAALGEETRAMGCDILLGPCVNIVRHPLAGRNFEAYSEDPYLAGKIGVGYVKGLQSRRIGASLKHYACNNQEIERFRGNSIVDERTLREIYLAQFEMVVKEADPWTVMCSYNRINGDYASQNHHLLKDILKGEWGYKGVVVSDWGANHSITESVEGGLDLEMPGPAKYYGRLLEEAVRTWQIDEATIDDAVRRILRMLIVSGKVDNEELPAGSLNTSAHQALARELAEESIVLLRNEGGLLPLQPDKLKRIAVIGPHGAVGSIGGGGSSFLESPYRVSPLEGLKTALKDQKVEVRFAQGCDSFANLPPLRAMELTTADGKPGADCQFWDNADFAGSPVVERIEKNRLDYWWFTAPVDEVKDAFSARWVGTLTAAETGRHTFGLSSAGFARLYLDGRLVLDNSGKSKKEEMHAVVYNEAALDLVAGQGCELKLEVTRAANEPFAHARVSFGFTPRPEEDHRFETAVELARQSDVAIVCVGLPENFESEGDDRRHMDLTGRQNELVEAVLAANPNTVVVLYACAPVRMPWAGRVPALVDAYYPGLEGGSALARILLGQVNPSGKLSVTFPRRLEDTPAYINYPGSKDVRYGEGIFVGYRYYDMRDMQPAFPFGFGLSYTSFEYSQLRLPAEVKAGQPVEVSLTVKNTGKVTGKEVVELYVQDVEASLPRPPKELKGFAKLELAPGESQEVTFSLDERALSFYDPYRKGWVAEPGQFNILVGASSRDIRVQGSFKLQ